MPARSGVRGLRRVGLWPAAGPLRPGRILLATFGLAVTGGAGLLSLPFAAADGTRTAPVDALFTATSAVTLTGLVTVDTASHWSTFGQIVIMLLVQAGGLAIMTLATMVALLVSGRPGSDLLARKQTRTPRSRDVRRVLRAVLLFSIIGELIVAVVLTARFALRYELDWGRAAYHGVFHAVTAFNNAGFSLNPDSLVRYAVDPWITATVVIAVIVGGLGFPVVCELVRSWRRPREWSVLTRITVTVTAALLVLGTVVLTLTEFTNPQTLGALNGSSRLGAGFFMAAQSRTGGFSTVDVAAMTPESHLVMDVLMFIGGGSAGTAGGVKVTTVGLLAYVIWAEARGERWVNVGARHVPESNQRQAVAVALLGLGLVTTTTFAIMLMARETLDRALFEVVSAFGTVGLSVGITPDLPGAGHVLLAALMFLGRIGPLTVASALALTDRGRRYEYPEERTIVG